MIDDDDCRRLLLRVFSGAIIEYAEPMYYSYYLDLASTATACQLLFFFFFLFSGVVWPLERSPIIYAHLFQRHIQSGSSAQKNTCSFAIKK